MMNVSACRWLYGPHGLGPLWRDQDFHRELWATYNDLLSTWIKTHHRAHYMFVVKRTPPPPPAPDGAPREYVSDCIETWVKLLQACNDEAHTCPPLTTAEDANHSTYVDHRRWVSHFLHFSHEHHSD